MSICRLVLREIAYRKLNFGLALVAATMAVACLAGVVTILRLYDRATGEIMAKHEDDIRKATLKLGFNVLILHKDQNLADLYQDRFPTKFMPEEYAQRLVQKKVLTIKHLLPHLQERVFWKELQRTVHLFGTRGEVDQSGKKPLVDAVPPGKIGLGFELHQGFKVKEGDRLRLSLSRQGPSGREDLKPTDFVVHYLAPQRGNEEDIHVFLNLADAQKILNRPGLINALKALECECGLDRLGNVRKEIEKILPDTQVVEYQSQALARAEARTQAAAKRGEIKHRQEDFAALLVPLVVLGCMVLLGVLAFINVYDRITEIGILRALGVSSIQVFILFLSKAILVGLLGAVIGYSLGTAGGLGLGETPANAALADFLLNGWLLGLVLLAAPLLCALASLIPAVTAARQDPAVVLQQE